MSTNTYGYVPIFKLKPGEITAMSKLTPQQKSQIVPLFEVVLPGAKKSDLKQGKEAKLNSIINKFLTQKLPDLPAGLMNACEKNPFILDFTLVFVEPVRQAAVEYILGECAKSGQNVTVSVNVGDTDEYKNLIFSYLKKYGFGLCIRVSRSDFIDITNLELKLQNIVRAVGLEISQIDLMIDLKEESDDEIYTKIFNKAQKLSTINIWKNFIFANGSFPESMGGLKAGKEHDILRTDLVRYKAAMSRRDIKRIPVFSDYSARYPIYDAEAEKHSPSPTIKYTTENHWRIMKGSDYDYGHYFVYSLALVSSNTYYGADHCEGDKFIKERADECPAYLQKRHQKQGKVKAKGAGSSEEWIMAAVSHHTVVTLDQLANLS